MKPVKNVLTVQVDTVASMTDTLQITQVQKREKSHFNKCTLLGMIPNIPRGQKEIMITDVVVSVRIPLQSVHHSPMAAQKNYEPQNVEPTLPPSGGACLSVAGHTKNIYSSETPNTKKDMYII